MIIGLSGWAQSGKDSVGSVLVANGFKRIAFADIMRAAALALDPVIGSRSGVGFEVVPERLSELVGSVGWDRAKQSPEVRRTLQRIGTDVGRDLFGENFWVDMTLAALDPHDNWVVTDVRFQNEADAVRSRGGSVWRVNRPGVVAPNDHISEHDLDGYSFDLHIHNDGTLDDLSHVVLDRMLLVGA